MIRVLFVCLGNICRSPMAEAVFRHQVKEAGLEGYIEADSAGTGDWHIGKPPHEGTRRLLDANRISWSGMTARQVSDADWRSFDYIVAMDSSNMGNLRAMTGYQGDGQDQSKPKPELFRLLDLVPESKLDDVPDPYYTGNFEETYALVTAGCGALLEKIKAERIQAGTR